MPLDSGARLGSFEILGPLGSGGMGEVYRARDLRLGRDVALKLLPEEFARDPDRVARFQREARLLAAVNHPAIAAIYGAEESGAREFIVMELVPGETLADKLGPGALPIDESLRIARQIAEALEAAHERGVVHRDLKPSNIKVTPDGKVKVLDLGLAKAMEPSSPDAAISNSPTLVADRTRPGTILGTAEYMSPEQARGKEVDKRGDIWAFGCILFEMLSGRRAFTGETTSDALVAILSSEPDWSALPRETPDRIRELLGRCLQKDAGQRLRDAGDARLEIESCLAEEGPRSDAREAVSRSQIIRRWAVALFAAALVAGSIAAWLALRGPRLVPPAGSPERPRSLVVLPSRDLSGAPGGQLVGDGLVETLSARLGELPGIQVVTPSVAVAAADRLTDPFRAAKSVGANLAVRSSFMRNGDLVRIAYSVWDVTNRSQVVSGTVDGSANDLFGIQDRLAESVASGLKLKKRAIRTPAPAGLDGAGVQERYLQALGNLQRYDKPAQVDAAIGLLDALGAEKPGSALVHAALGRAYLHRYTLSKTQAAAQRAYEESERALSLDERLPDVQITFGQVLTRTGKPAEAIPHFQSALELQPNSLEAILGLAAAYQSAQRATEAESTYRRAISLQPDYWAPYNQLGAFYYGRGRYADAAEMFRRVVRLAPDSVRGFNNLGAALQQLDRFEDARDAYAQSARLSPNDGAYSNLGTLEFFLGHYAEAGKAFEQATRLSPAKALYWLNLGDAYRWTPGQRARAVPAYERAIRLAEQAIAINPRDPFPHANLGVACAKTGRASRADSEIRKAIELGPGNPDTLHDAAVVAVLGGKPEEAIQRIREAISAGLGRAQIERDPELGSLRGRAEFKAALRQGATPGKQN